MTAHFLYRFQLIVTFAAVVFTCSVRSSYCQGFVIDKEKLKQWVKADRTLQYEAPSTKFSSNAGKGVPNVKLPAHVQADLGKLSLYADFDNKTEDGVPLYLVNRTGKAVSFGCQDGNIYLKLEFRDENGKWVRAQNHNDSWCGNSYFGLSLNTGEHFSVFGYMPWEGVPVTVRYRTYNNTEIISNSGPGRYSKSDLLAASLDSISRYHIPRTLLGILGNAGLYANRNVVNVDTYAAALSLFSQYEDSAYIRREARRRLEILDPSSEAAAKIKRLLSAKWQQERDDKRLFVLCRDTLVGKAEQPEIAILTQYPEILWGIMADLLWKNVSGAGFNNEEWNDLSLSAYELLPMALESGRRGTFAANRLLDLTGPANEYITDENLFKWLSLGESHVVRSCSKLLSMRGKYSELAQAAYHLERSNQLLVLQALALRKGANGRRVARNPEERSETAFWEFCAEKYPIKTVQALYFTGYSRGNSISSYNMVLHKPLRQFLLKEAELGVNSPAEVHSVDEGYPLSQVANFVGRWKRKEDIPIFQLLLKHPSYQKSVMSNGSGNKWEMRRYRVRREAKKILIDMEVPIEGGVVVEERAPTSEGI